MARPRVLIEQWLPIAEIGAECMRERGASSALPPLYFLHVWWARRPLTVSRAAILASLLPAYPVDGDEDFRPWPKKFLKRFPTFDAYTDWFLQILGILGSPAASRKIINWARTQGVKLTPAIIQRLPAEWIAGLPNDMGVSIPFGYPRAFTSKPNEQQLDVIYDLLEWTWGTREISFCDPMAGGGSIPFEAMRCGLSVHANELNPVASVILKATLDYPVRFGTSLVDDIRKYGKTWSARVRKRLEPFFPTTHPDENIFAYIWAMTVACPTTGKPVPLSPNWWLRKGSDPVALRLVADTKATQCRFEIVRGRTDCAQVKADRGTIRQGTGVSPWTGEAIDGDYIKGEAQAGRMREQLIAVISKGSSGPSYRLPSEDDDEAIKCAADQLRRQQSIWEANGCLPDDDITGPSNYERGHKLYGKTAWRNFFSSRQLFSLGTIVEEFFRVRDSIDSDLDEGRATAVKTYLAMAFDKALSHNSNACWWDGGRFKVVNIFSKHGFAMKWSYAEYDAARNLLPWSMEQAVDSYTGLAKLATERLTFWSDFGLGEPVDCLQVTQGSASVLTGVDRESVHLICVDPPYYDNVMYAELSDFYGVWLRRLLANEFSEFWLEPMANKDDEVTANRARFADRGRKKTELARDDYERKIAQCFREMREILRPEGILTLMFTHKSVDAWDTLGSALIAAGFLIDASWPVHTESENNLHQAKVNAASSTILLVCRKRDKSGEPVWWDDLKEKVRQTARQKAAEFEHQGIRGVDLYISTFGPVLSIISEHWPVLTSGTDPKTGDPMPLKPGEALDLAREEVVNLRKRGLLLGRAVEFDPVSDWYLMAWDAFRAERFPADEARKLALALGLDLERTLIREKKLVTKKSADVILNLPCDRRKRGMVDPDVETFPHMIDALHTAMMVYDEEGSKSCQLFVDRQGLRTDSRTKALVQAMIEAIPTTRGKEGQFLRPEMTTLDAMRMLFWEDLPAPKEEEPLKLDPQGRLFDEDEEQ